MALCYSFSSDIKPSLVDNANHLVDPVFGSQTTVLSNCYLQAEQKSAFGMKKKNHKS